MYMYMNVYIFVNLYLFALNYSEKNTNNTELKKTKKLPFYMRKTKKTGHDFRNNTIEQIDMDILDSIKTQEILLKLQSDNLSIFQKILIIEELDKEQNYVPNIENGGLLDGWNDIF